MVNPMASALSLGVVREWIAAVREVNPSPNNLQITIAITGITQNEPVNSTGDGESLGLVIQKAIEA